MDMIGINYVVCGQVCVVFNRSCFPKMKDYSRLRSPKGSHLHRKCGCRPIKEIVQDRHVVIGRIYGFDLCHRFVPSPVTLDDLEGHSPVAGLIKCNSVNICATFRMVSTDTARCVVSWQ